MARAAATARALVNVCAGPRTSKVRPPSRQVTTVLGVAAARGDRAGDAAGQADQPVVRARMAGLAQMVRIVCGPTPLPGAHTVTGRRRSASPEA